MRDEGLSLRGSVDRCQLNMSDGTVEQMETVQREEAFIDDLERIESIFFALDKDRYANRCCWLIDLCYASQRATASSF